MSNDRVTLKKGDYVSTKGMTEDQYHAVERAFMAAGAVKFGSDNKHKEWSHVAWSSSGVFMGSDECSECLRHLTPVQVIGATNSGGKAQDTLTGALKYACDEIDTARQYEAKAAEHRANHDGAMEHVRDMIPDGWRLVRVEEQDVDMTDPANWREGDVLVCVNDKNVNWVTKGKTYVLLGWDNEKWPMIRDDDGDRLGLAPRRFRFHNRPT